MNQQKPRPRQFDISEFFYIKKEISECSSFYATLYNLAHCEFSEDIPTACITFDKEGNTLNMKINPTFWDGLNETAKTFVVLHELSHVVYDHPKRFVHLQLDFELANIASDIVINHNLYRNYGIVRENFDWEKYCWVETCFKDSKVIPDPDRSFEFYYNLLNENRNQPDVELLGSHSNGEEPSEDNESSNNPSTEKDIDGEKAEMDDFGNIKPKPKKPGKEDKPEISDLMKEIIEQNPELVEEFNGDPSIESLGFDPIKETSGHTPKMQTERSGKEAEFQMQELPNFDKLMKILTPPVKKKYREEENETWVGTHRRYMSYLDNNPQVSLPNIYYSQKLLPPKKKNVWIFIDNSGSCSGMFHTFSTIAVSLMKSKEVECRGFTFGDTCDEIKLSDKMHISFYAGNDGGFDCIENKIKNIMTKEKIAYPDNIVVLSDGGAEFRCINKLVNPKAWIMLINNNYHQKLTPPGGKYMVCDSQFFKKPQPKKPKM